MITGWKKYFIVFLLTLGVFAVAVYVSSYINKRKLFEVQTLQNKVATEILSSETQLQLLEDLSCESGGNSYLSKELGALADRLMFAEQNSTAQEALNLKEQYSILQIKDFLLSKRVGERCGDVPVTILYFYNDKAICADCTRQGYVLDALRAAYPKLRIYSFDYNLDLSTIKALISIYEIDKTPSLVVNGKTVNGFSSVEEIKALLPKDFINPPASKDIQSSTTR